MQRYVFYIFCLIIYLVVRPDYIKDLGVFFDSDLSFSHHIDECLAGAYKSLGFVLRNSKDFKDISTLRLLFITFVRSRLEYASVIWCPIYTTYMTLIERVQEDSSNLTPSF